MEQYIFLIVLNELSIVELAKYPLFAEYIFKQIVIMYLVSNILNLLFQSRKVLNNIQNIGVCLLK